jgi:hypothetical protein
VTPTYTAADLGRSLGSPPRVSTDPGSDTRSTVLASPSDRREAGLAAGRIASDAAGLCPCIRLQWLYGL